MEVAGQWRRQWAGTAEYGKVTEGGVTRRVARAMEVLHASAPGARVRVLRAAYHSTAGPGAPASSYLMHSSRRVISSGYNFTEPPSSPSKPLEISSTPLESSPELDAENENYKVTEPDDLDISEPSKWKGSKSVNNIRMPSEESSSTDNGSIIDLDYSNKNTIRNHTDFTTNFIPQTRHKKMSPIYSLLDSPVTLSTLKYTSLLNGNDSWNNRRKSYSFEETPELDESVLRESNAVNMESSTDSGICKSSEIVNSENCNLDNLRYVERKVRMDDIHEETFKDWLSKDRQKPFKNQVSQKKEHIDVELNDKNYITLQSVGKVSITLSNTSPTPSKENNIYEVKKSHPYDDYDKKTKKVEFCKTELHFAAESGTVNIIATDEKPPPSCDFRKKRSIFVPISNNYNKSITLFGEKTDLFEDNKNDASTLLNNTIDENTAATKSILKNKIPKPKPYLLGENMVFGNSIDHHSGSDKKEMNNLLLKPTGVSLINTQITPEFFFNNDSQLSGTDWSSINKCSTRTTKTGPVSYSSANVELDQGLSSNIQTENDVNVIKSKLKILQMSPSSPRPKTRQLRESDLTYFGVAKKCESLSERRKHSLDSIYDENNLREEILHSVQLVKSVSNSVCNSEVDSDEAPDYENIQMKYNFAPKPALRSRFKYQSYLDSNIEQRDLNPILEKEDDTIIVETRRPKTRKHVVTQTSRSISEPPKANRQRSIEKFETPLRKVNCIKDSSLSKNNLRPREKGVKGKISDFNGSEIRPESTNGPQSRTESPLYINLKKRETRNMDDNNHIRNKQCGIEQQKNKKEFPKVTDDLSNIKHSKTKSNYNMDNINKSVVEKSSNTDKQKAEERNSGKKKTSVRRTKVLVTPDKSPGKCREISSKKLTEKGSLREKRTITSPIPSHHSLKADSQECVKDSQCDHDSKESKASTSETERKAPAIQKKLDKLSIETTSKQKPAEVVHFNDTMRDLIMSQPKVNKPAKIDKIQNKVRRSKYVINYDDKNGTVSSICKIRSDHGTTKKIKNVNYDTKENFKSLSLKNDKNKIDSQQHPDQQWILNGNYMTKSKIRAKKYCDIL